MTIQSPSLAPPAPAWAAAVCAGVRAAGVHDVVYVPDNPLSSILGELERAHRDVRLLLATREEEAFGIAAGLYLGGRVPAVFLQSSGLGNSVNALGTLLVPYRIPVLIVVSMRGGAAEWNPAQEPMGRAVRPMFGALGIPHVTLPIERGNTQDIAAMIADTAATAFAAKLPGACLLPRALTATASGGISAADATRAASRHGNGR